MDANGYSLSDIAAASGSEGFGGGSWWIIVLFLFAMMGGGFGFNRQGDFGQYATSASQNEILLGQKFDSLSQQINQVGDGLCSSTYALNNAINGVNQNLGGLITNEGRSIQNQLCAINSNIDNKFAALEKSQLEQRIAEQSQQINQLQLAQALCGVPKMTTTVPCNTCAYSYAN